MKIYIVEDKNLARKMLQLIKLNAECAKLQWSTTITNIPQDVSNALYTIEDFVEKEVEKDCQCCLGRLTEEEEDSLMRAIRNEAELKNILGSGVILEGSQIEYVKKIINRVTLPQKVTEAINSGKNVVIF